MAHEHIVYMMLVDSAATARDVDTIHKYAPLLEELAIRDDHQPYLAIAYRAQGVANRLEEDYQQSEIQFQKALKIFEGMGARWQCGRTFYEIGKLAQHQGNASLAREMFSRALADFEKIQAEPDIARTKVALDKLTIDEK